MSLKERFKPYIALPSTALFLAGLLMCAPLLQGVLTSLVDATSYIVWHTTFEFSSIIIAICIFCVAYYSFEQNQNFRYLFLGSMLLLMGFIDFFHTLSYKGMPDFLVSYSTSNRATTFWIIARLTGGFGLLVSSLIPPQINRRVNKSIFLILPILLSLVILIQVTYYPDLLPPMYIEGEGLTGIKIMLEIVVMLSYLFAIFAILNGYNRYKDKNYILLCCALLVGIFSELSFTLYTDVYGIYNFLGHLLKAIMYFLIFRITFIQNIRQPYLDLSLARDEIKNYADNLDKIVEQRTEQLKLINKNLLDDLEYARGIQMAMLPKKLPDSSATAFEACYFPAERVGGDFYNIFQIEETKIGMYIGDVSGHGVSAAMLTVFLNQTIKTEKENTHGIREPLLPAEVLTKLFNDFNQAGFAGEVYIVMLYGIYDLISKEFIFASAGLNVPPLIVTPAGKVQELVIKGFPICKFPRGQNIGYYDSRVRLNKGEKMLFYTDGLIEAENRDQEQYSESRLKALLQQNRYKDVSQLSKCIEEDVLRFMGNKKHQDDITFFIMEIK